LDVTIEFFSEIIEIIFSLLGSNVPSLDEFLISSLDDWLSSVCGIFSLFSPAVKLVFSSLGLSFGWHVFLESFSNWSSLSGSNKGSVNVIFHIEKRF
jgi:hypothetical protein